MTVVDRHFAARLTGAFLRIAVALVLLFVVVDFLTARQDQMYKYDVPAAIVAEYYLAWIPSVLFGYQTAAIAMLVAALMVLGRASETNEMTALLAGGVGLWRAMRAPIAVALAVAAGAFAFDETLGARLTARAEQLDAEYFSAFTSKNRPGVSWAKLEGRWNCHILKFNPAANSGEDVYLHRIGPETTEEIRADRIYWDPARRVWMLEGGTWMHLDTAQDWSQRVERITQRPAPIAETPEALFALEAPPETKPARVLYADIERAEARGLPVASSRVDLHAKFARPVLIFVMMLLAIPFAMRVRRGGFAAGLGMGVGIALAYLTVAYIAGGLGHIGKLPPAVAAWSANAIFAAAAALLGWRTPT